MRCIRYSFRRACPLPEKRREAGLSSLKDRMTHAQNLFFRLFRAALRYLDARIVERMTEIDDPALPLATRLRQ